MTVALQVESVTSSAAPPVPLNALPATSGNAVEAEPLAPPRLRPSWLGDDAGVNAAPSTDVATAA
jgi:hypothetical protein